MTDNVLLCPAMSFYVPIKVKKIGIYLYLWSLFRIFTSESFTVRAPLVGALLTSTWMYSGTHKGCPYRKPYIKHHKSYIKNVYSKNLWQGRAGFALPAIEQTRNRVENPLPMDKRMSSPDGRIEIHELQSETPHVPSSGGGGDCPSSRYAVTVGAGSARPDNTTVIHRPDNINKSSTRMYSGRRTLPLQATALTTA